MPRIAGVAALRRHGSLVFATNMPGNTLTTCIEFEWTRTASCWCLFLVSLCMTGFSSLAVALNTSDGVAIFFICVGFCGLIWSLCEVCLWQFLYDHLVDEPHGIIALHQIEQIKKYSVSSSSHPEFRALPTPRSRTLDEEQMIKKVLQKPHLANEFYRQGLLNEECPCIYKITHDAIRRVQCDMSSERMEDITEEDMIVSIVEIRIFEKYRRGRLARGGWITLKKPRLQYVQSCDGADGRGDFFLNVQIATEDDPINFVAKLPNDIHEALDPRSDAIGTIEVGEMYFFKRIITGYGGWVRGQLEEGGWVTLKAFEKDQKFVPCCRRGYFFLHCPWAPISQIEQFYSDDDYPERRLTGSSNSAAYSSNNSVRVAELNFQQENRFTNFSYPPSDAEETQKNVNIPASRILQSLESQEVSSSDQGSACSGRFPLNMDKMTIVKVKREDTALVLQESDGSVSAV